MATGCIRLDEVGMLIIQSLYAWDGPSGPAIDTPDAMRGYLGHDALCQLMRMGLLGRKWISHANKLYHKWCLEDNMWPPRAWWHFKGTNIGGKSATDPKNRRKVIIAPAILLSLFLGGCASIALVNDRILSTVEIVARELLEGCKVYVREFAHMGLIREQYFSM